jgi:septal ring factor EnvC (AmiA/AmiB activator)
MHDADQLISPLGPAPRFATAFRGYDRSQVDSWLRDHEGELAEVAGPLAATTRRQQALESRLAELESPEAPDESDEPDELSPQSLAAFVLGRAHDIARELPDHIVRDAETERQRLAKTTTQAIQIARARSAQIIGAAQRDLDRVASAVDEARRQIDVFREQADATARARVQRTWQETTAALAELEVELAGLRAERHAVVSELSQLEEEIEASRAQLRKVRAIDVDVVQPVEMFGLQPERRRWSLMPVEW